MRTNGEIAIVGKDLPAAPSAFHLHGQVETGPIDTGEGTEVVRVGVFQIEGVGQEVKTRLAIGEDVVAVGVRNGGVRDREVQIREEIERLALQGRHLRYLRTGEGCIDRRVVPVKILHVLVRDER